jgi:hypothetical protein
MNDIAARRNGRCRGGLAERAVIAALHQGHPARWVVADRGDLLLSPGGGRNLRSHGITIAHSARGVPWRLVSRHYRI